MNYYHFTELIKEKTIEYKIDKFVAQIKKERLKLIEEDYCKQIDILNNVYNLAKLYSTKLYTNNQMHYLYECIKHEVVDCEWNLKKHYIIDAKENFDYDDDSILTKKKESVNDILDYIVYKSML